MDLIRYEMVWKQTLITYREMVSAERWSNKKEIDIPVVQKLTFKVSSTLLHSVLAFSNILSYSFHQLALIIIGKCGFGFSFNWFTPPKSHAGKMPAQKALEIATKTYMFALFLPKWIKNLPIKRHVKLIPHYPTATTLLTPCFFFLSALSGCKNRKRPTSSSWNSCIPKSLNAKPRLRPGPPA